MTAGSFFRCSATASVLASSWLGGPARLCRYETIPAASRGPSYSVGESALPLRKICSDGDQS